MLGSLLSPSDLLQRKVGDVVFLLPPLPGETFELLHQGGLEADCILLAPV